MPAWASVCNSVITGCMESGGAGCLRLNSLQHVGLSRVAQAICSASSKSQKNKQLTRRSTYEKNYRSSGPAGLLRGYGTCSRGCRTQGNSTPQPRVGDHDGESWFFASSE